MWLRDRKEGERIFTRRQRSTTGFSSPWIFVKQGLNTTFGLIFPPQTRHLPSLLFLTWLLICCSSNLMMGTVCYLVKYSQSAAARGLVFALFPQDPAAGRRFGDVGMGTILVSVLVRLLGQRGSWWYYRIARGAGLGVKMHTHTRIRCQNTGIYAQTHTHTLAQMHEIAPRQPPHLLIFFSI